MKKTKLERATMHSLALDKFRGMPRPSIVPPSRKERRARAKAQGLDWSLVETVDVTNEGSST